MAGNQLGKCATVSSYIELADGTRATFGEMFLRGRPFRVMAWDGRKAVEAWAVEPIKKKPEPCVRLWFRDGSWFECALNHRVLLASGVYVLVSELLSAFLPSRQASSLEFGRLIRGEDDRDCLQTLPGFLGGCLASLRFCDARLHGAQAAVRAFARRLADAPQRSFVWSGSDVCLSTHTSSHQLERVRPSSLGAYPQIAGRFAAFLDRGACKFARCTTASIQGLQRIVLGLAARLRLIGAGNCGQFLQGAYEAPGKAGNQIIAYETIAIQEVYDFSVPVYENYIANGIAHHNTLAGAAEVAIHLTGQYPAWWTGRRFDKPVRWLAGSESAELTRKGIQRLLVGPPEQEDTWGTGFIPKAALVTWDRRQGVPNTLDNVVVTHKTGGNSVLEFKSYDQGRSKWQADTVDGVWFDEEPPEDVYTEGVTRTNATRGMVFITFTPLLGMSAVVKRFLLEKSQDRHVTTMTIDDAEHYTPEERARIIAAYPEHEREARSKGIPALGSGRVFPVSEESIQEGAVQIAAHWVRICGLDIGWDHPTAAVWLAWDRDTDTVHVYDCYRVKEQTPVVHAAAIKGRGDWIPVAWPHDGLQHDKGSGVTIAQQYRDQKVNMLPEKATFPDGSNGVEAGVLEILDRMKTGRFKVASHLADWWEEFRLYHRKDGQIVKEGDDLMSATRYALMMIRHACVKPQVYKNLAEYRMPGAV